MRRKRTRTSSIIFHVIPRIAALGAGVLSATLGLLSAGSAGAASLQPVNDWGANGVPQYISMFIYVPDKPAPNPPILVVSHYCGGSANGVFGQARGAGIVAAADQYGFILIVPQTTNPASSANCWDVGSKQSLTHDGGGDTQAVAQMVKYTIATYGANADRVYATGDSSGAMMTQALLAVYPDVFKAGASFAGVPAGCWSAGWSAASNWGGTCAGGNDIQSASQWGELVRGMYPEYTGHRPRVQLFHGDADAIINYKNFAEGIKEWTNVLGLDTNPTSTTSGITLGNHQATRQQWKNSCGFVVLDAFSSLGGDHGPSDALFNSSFVIPFLGLDTVGPVDPQIAACPDEGDGTTGKGDGSAGAGGNNGLPPESGGSGNDMPSTVHPIGIAGAANGVDATGSAAPMNGAVATLGTGGPASAAAEGSAAPGAGPSDAARSSGGLAASAADSSGGCALGAAPATSHAPVEASAFLGLALSAFARRRRRSCSTLQGKQR